MELDCLRAEGLSKKVKRSTSRSARLATGAMDKESQWIASPADKAR